MKKIILFTIITSLVLYCFSINGYNEDVIASVEGTQYYIFNCNTKSREGRYTLPPLNNFNNSINQLRDIYFPDDRVLDYTNSGMVKIISSSGNNFLPGSAFVIGDHLIATAAHCVVSYSDSQHCKYIKDLLLFDENGNISLRATPVEVHVEKNYFSSDNTSGDPDIYANDYAVIVVEEDLSTYQHLQLTTTTNNFYDYYGDIYLTGFPEEIINDDNHYETVNDMNNLHNEYTSATQHIIHMDNKYLYYRNDNTSGNSGGPVYLRESYNGDDYYSVVAINVNSVSEINLGNEVIFPMGANEGVRVTTKLLQFYYNNDNLSFWY